MTSIHFVDDVRRVGAYGVWSAIALPDGSQCSALRLPVREDQEDIIENVVAATQAVSRANLAGVAPVADVMLGGDEAWLLVAIPPSLSLAELRVSYRLNAGEIALIALDIGHTLDSLHVEGLAAGAVDDRTIIVSRFGNAVLTEVGLTFALGDAELLGDPDTWTDLFGRGPGDSAGTRRPMLASPPPRPDRAAVVRADTHAWAGLVDSLADGMRTGGELHGTPLHAVADRARRDGLGPALAMLGVAARVFPGYPSRANLSHMVRQRTGRGHTSADLMEAIDRLLGGAVDDVAAPVSAPVGGQPRNRPAPPLPPARGVPGRVGAGSSGPMPPRPAVPGPMPPRPAVPGPMPPRPAVPGAVPVGAVPDGVVPVGLVGSAPAAAGPKSRGDATDREAAGASAPVSADAAARGAAAAGDAPIAPEARSSTDISDSSGSPRLVDAARVGGPSTDDDLVAPDDAITVGRAAGDPTADATTVAGRTAAAGAEAADDPTVTVDAMPVAGATVTVGAMPVAGAADEDTATEDAITVAGDTAATVDVMAVVAAADEDTATEDAITVAGDTAATVDATAVAEAADRTTATPEAATDDIDAATADNSTTARTRKRSTRKADTAADDQTAATPETPAPAKPAKRRKPAAPAVTPEVDLFGNVEGAPVQIPGPPRTPTSPKTPRTPMPAARPMSVRIGAGVPAGRSVRPRRLGRRRNTRLLAVNVGLVGVLVTALLGIQGWRADRVMRVTDVAVTVNQIPGTGCHIDADVTGTIKTEGPAGKLTYQWQRNDGGTTDPVTVSIRDTGAPTVVHLRWTFTGVGEESVSIALKVLSPQEKQAVYSFVYRCM